jgi:PTS system mannose-specific IIA component
MGRGMYNILIVSHGSIAKGFYETIEMITGKIEGIRYCGIEPGEGVHEFGDRLLKLADEIYTENGLLVLVDLYGGTPSNVSIMKLLNGYDRVYMISGVNLPILLETIGLRDFSSLEESVNVLVNIGKDGIMNVNEVVRERMGYSDDE